RCNRSAYVGWCASLLPSWGWSNEIRRMAGDHQLFIGGNDPGGDAARAAADARAAIGVRARIELDAEPGRIAAHALAQCGRVLADASGKDQRIEPVQRGGERAKLAADAVEIEIHRELRARLV